MKINSFKDLTVWKKSMELIDMTYHVTERLPKSEQYGLVSQLNRSTLSIASNIAEGSKRGTRNDFRQFLRIALGSSAEVETQLLVVSMRYPDIDVDNCLAIVQEVQKMLTAFIAKL